MAALQLLDGECGERSHCGDVLEDDEGMAPFTREKLEPAYAEVRLPRYRRRYTLSRELDASRIEPGSHRVDVRRTMTGRAMGSAAA